MTGTPWPLHGKPQLHRKHSSQFSSDFKPFRVILTFFGIMISWIFTPSPRFFTKKLPIQTSSFRFLTENPHHATTIRTSKHLSMTVARVHTRFAVHRERIHRLDQWHWAMQRLCTMKISKWKKISGERVTCAVQHVWMQPAKFDETVCKTTCTSWSEAERRIVWATKAHHIKFTEKCILTQEAIHIHLLQTYGTQKFPYNQSNSLFSLMRKSTIKTFETEMVVEKSYNSNGWTQILLKHYRLLNKN